MVSCYTVERERDCVNRQTDRPTSLFAGEWEISACRPSATLGPSPTSASPHPTLLGYQGQKSISKTALCVCFVSEMYIDRKDALVHMYSMYCVHRLLVGILGESVCVCVSASVSALCLWCFCCPVYLPG